jgi:hypothetical protein
MEGQQLKEEKVSTETISSEISGSQREEAGKNREKKGEN